MSRLLEEMSGRGQRRKPAKPDSPPDLLADADNLSDITRVRDAVRDLRRDARKSDADSDTIDGSCEADTLSFCLLLCGRIIGGQKRELTELDRACVEQVLGIQIDPAELSRIGLELRSRPVAELDAVFPDLLRRKAAEEVRSYDPCDHVIRQFETIASSTGSV